jgi:hypothetical protein
LSSVFSLFEPSGSRRPLGSREGTRTLALPSSEAMATIPADIGLDMVRVLNRMLDELRSFLAPVSGLPDPAVILISLNDAPVGLGRLIGEEPHSMFGGTELRGGRLGGVVRFALWGTDAPAVNEGMLNLQAALLAATQSLFSRGFLRFNALTSSNPALDSTLNAWGRTTDYSLLYEYRYPATDAADSLIARIPIHSDLEVRDSLQRETTVVTDEMVRWDNEASPTLVVRGRFSLGSLAALAFIPGTAPDGAVTLTRTFDGAAGPRTTYPSLPALLAAVVNTNSPERDGQFTFNSFSDFMAAFTEEQDFIEAEEHLGSEPIPITLKGRPVIKNASNLIRHFIAATGLTRSLQILYGGGLPDDDPGAPGPGQVKVDRTTGGLVFGDAVASADKVIATYAVRALVSLGDWDEDGRTDKYQPRTLTLEQAIELPSVADRFEIAHENAAFNQTAVVYLRVMRR